jgi:hypothetical protein
MVTAKHRALDVLRRERTAHTFAPELGRSGWHAWCRLWNRRRRRSAGDVAARPRQESPEWRCRGCAKSRAYPSFGVWAVIRKRLMAIIDGLLFTVTLVAALGCGLMAGLFFAFSVSVMKAFARLPSAEGIGAMQSINVAIINPVFLAVFLWNGGSLRPCNNRFALAMARSRCRLLAHWWRPVSGRNLFGDVDVQRA